MIIQLLIQVIIQLFIRSEVGEPTQLWVRFIQPHIVGELHLDSVFKIIGIERGNKVDE